MINYKLLQIQQKKGEHAEMEIKEQLMRGKRRQEGGDGGGPTSILDDRDEDIIFG